MLSLDPTVDFFEGLVATEKPRGYWLTFENLLKALNARRIRPVFAGALALQAHGVTRATSDIDLLIHPERRNTALSVLGALLELREDLDTLVVFEDRKTGVEVDVLVPYDSISLAACSDPTRSVVRGHRIQVVRLPDLVAMKVVAAVDSPAIEGKQRGDIDALLRMGNVPVNQISRTLQDEVGAEYARYFIERVRHARANPKPLPPRRRIPRKD